RSRRGPRRRGWPVRGYRGGAAVALRRCDARLLAARARGGGNALAAAAFGASGGGVSRCRLARIRPCPRDLLRQHLHGLADLLLGVRGGAEEPQAGGGLLHGGIEDGLDVDAAVPERVADREGVQRVPQDGGDQRALLREARVDPLLLGEPQEQRGALVHARDLLRMRLELAQGLQRRRGVRLREADAVDEPARRVLEELDDLLRLTHVAAAGCEALAQRAHPQVHLGPVHAAALADPRAGL